MALHEIIAGRIEADMATANGPLLPSGRDLSRHYGVSRTVVREALDLLAQKGVLSLAPRRRAAIAAYQPPQPLPSGSTADRLYREIAEGISSGAYPAAAPLPKIHYFVVHARLSAHTVRSVFDRLIAEGLAYRLKGKVIVGKQPSIADGARVTSQPVIVVLVDRPGTWLGLDRGSRTHPFCSTFASETRRRGVRAVIALARGDVKHTSTEGAAAGMNQVGRLIADLDDRYIGMLIPMELHRTDDPAALLSGLAGRGKPVVWLDRIGQRPDFDLPPRNFLRCFHSERANVVAALDHVARWGHRSLAYIHDPRDDWSTARCRTLEEEAARRGDLHILGQAYHGLASWEAAREGPVPALLERLRGHASPPVVRSINSLVQRRDTILAQHGDYCPVSMLDSWSAPHFALAIAWLRDRKRCAELVLEVDTILGSTELTQAFTDGTVTCLIAPNDRQGIHLHAAWLHRAGLQTPRDMSLISFDNEFGNELLPLTTVNPGFDTAAYQIVHFLLGDIRISGIRQGELPCPASVVDNGSVGPAPARPVMWG